MTPTGRSNVLTAVAILAAASWLSAQQPPPRDADRQQPSRSQRGSGAIAGKVLSSGSPAVPIRRATVTVSPQPGSTIGARQVVTNDDGSFEVSGLAAGRYFVTAAKSAYLPAAFGSTRPARMGSAVTGTAVPLADGQRIADITLTMTRGGVITGTVRDTDGRPARGANVALGYFRRTGAAGERMLSGVPGGEARTDSRGVYRIYGVAPGDYVLMGGFQGQAEARDVEVTTDADLRRVVEISRPGNADPAAPTGAMANAMAARRPTVGYTPVYYPNAIVLSQAQPISIAPGEERAGVDLQVQLIPNSRVDGKVTAPDGKPAGGVRVSLTTPILGGGTPVSVRSSMTDSAGVFRITGVSPGDYVVEIRPEPGRAGGPGAGWARAPLSLAPSADASVEVTLRAPLSVSGQLVFEQGATPPPEELSRVRLLLVNETGGGSAIGTVSADGRFSAAGLLPDRYRVTVTVPGAPGPSGAVWYVKSAAIGGRDAVDAAVDLASVGDLNSAVVTMTDRVTEISGVIQDSAGRPATEFFIIAFPADRAHWGWNSRRIQQARPARDGRFTFRNLPPGEYLIGAVTDVELNEWFENAFLETLYGVSVKLTLSPNARVVQDLRIK